MAALEEIVLRSLSLATGYFFQTPVGNFSFCLGATLTDDTNIKKVKEEEEKGLKHVVGDVPTCLKTQNEGKTKEYERKEVQRRSSSIKNKKMRTEFISPSEVRTAKEQRYSRSGSLRQKQKESR